MFAKSALFAPALIALGNVSAADPGRPPLAQACAVFDVHVLTLLEDDGQAATTTRDGLTRAVTALVDARVACSRGNYDLALDRYSRIDLRSLPASSSDLTEAR